MFRGFRLKEKRGFRLELDRSEFRIVIGVVWLCRDRKGLAFLDMGN